VGTGCRRSVASIWEVEDSSVTETLLGFESIEY
jgi:hypothetical protein